MTSLPAVALFLLPLLVVLAGPAGRTVAADETASQAAVAALTQAMAAPPAGRPAVDKASFATTALTRTDAGKAQSLLWQDYAASVKDTYAADWKAKTFTIGRLIMKFDYITYGVKPETGWDFYISMHGGGGAPAQVNESQWRNQIRLYKPAQGIYLAPRAPTDTWNLWHEGHMDEFFDLLIRSAVVAMDVNPNRIYLMGFSAGGDGVYQMAPRMADRWAAAAMMSGHPNGVSPLNLRNIGFTLHAGELDRAYNRNQVAAEWKDRLARLRAEDPGGYANECVIHKGLGHWMNLRDAVALPWMAQFTRNPYPDKVVWRRDDLRKTSFYWLAMPDDQKQGGAEMVVERQNQEITILRASGVDTLTLRFNDRMLDLDKPVRVLQNGKRLFEGVLPRTVAVLSTTLQRRFDRDLMFCSEVTVPVSTNTVTAAGN